jgi:serine/threonine-protein kinase HipA
MNRCPITYLKCNHQTYSSEGLKLLSPQLKNLNAIPFSASEQRQEALNRAGKLSIQGVQPKLSAVLSIKNQSFEIVDQLGKFIIKPQNDLFPQLPENEDLTMKMAKIFKIEVPIHGLVYSKDNSLSYFIKRFDRYERNKKLQVEDFSQLTGNTRDTKYNFTIEKTIRVINDFCTFPAIEKVDYFRRILFCFITGNEDKHLKNFSLITRNSKITLAPAYDFLNSTIAIKNPQEEMALSLKGKKSNFKSYDFVDYFAKERLELNEKSIDSVIAEMTKNIPKWRELIEISFLSDTMKTNYLNLLNKKCKLF